MSRPFKSSRKAALAVLNSGIRLDKLSGQFMGQLVATNLDVLSRPQADWVANLLKRAKLPQLDLRSARGLPKTRGTRCPSCKRQPNDPGDVGATSRPNRGSFK